MSLYLGEKLISGNSTPVEPTRNIGQIIESTLPLTDAGLHLLDGALIDGSGSYSAFVDYIAGLTSTYPNLFDTEANWQTAVTAYGVCGKFVYDSINNTVRLPKITGIVEGTTDTTALGDLVEAGLPNITGKANSGFLWDAIVNSQGALECKTSTMNNNAMAYAAGNDKLREININASRSNSIYGNSSTVQPQTIKVLYYIVIATNTKTEIEVDIDNIATDLNGKADVDLTNANDIGTSTGASWAMPSNIYENLTLGASGTEYTAPANGWILVGCTGTAGSTYMEITSNSQSACASYNGGWGRAMAPVLKGQTFSVYYGGTNFVSRLFRFVYAKGSESEAS